MTTNDIRVSICLLPFAMLLAVSGCKSPFDSTRNASGGATGTLGTASSFVVFSDELETGGGAFEYPGPDGQNLVFTDTSNPISRRSIRYSWTGRDVSNPQGSGCLPNPEHIFAGFDLMHVPDNTPTLSVYNSTPGRNLSKAGYTKATFYVRGSLSSNTILKVEAASPGVPASGCPVVTSPCLILYANANDLAVYEASPGFSTNCQPAPTALTGSWQSYSMSIAAAIANSSQPASAIKDFFKATFVYTPPGFGAPSGQGGIAYFDQIQYQQ